MADGTAINKVSNTKKAPKNGFNPVTNIEFSVPKASFITLTVFDASGRFVKTLVNENVNAGKYKVDFSAGELASGIYFYTLKAGSFVETKKMMLIK